MSIKRTLLALITMMLLPALAFAQPTPVPVTPAPDTAVIAVINEFADGNAEDYVLVNITCSSGSISPSFATLANGEGVSFVVANLPDLGVPTTCTVTQSPLDDYDASYLCFPGSGGASETDPTSCSGDGDLNTATSCEFLDVEPYDGVIVQDKNVGYCAITSTPTPVDVDVTKVWETFGAEQADFDPDVRITLTCPDALEVCAGTDCDSDTAWIDLKDADGDFDDEDDNYIGEGVAEFTVIPTWYPTAADPDDQKFTECSATENVSASAVEVDNDCGDIEVEAGMGDECTITNTVFFEGIPTLSQYGMAIMALLMLGVGFIGMRRFV
jgi:hypothetical protein